ncbi:MAG: hypothetical protein JWR16_842 [Nevskia sp.]|nr:hypothetical protein [Nevskia sp.]
MNAAADRSTATLRSPVAYFLLLVFLVSAFNQADRLLIGIVSQPIKDEFELSDTLIGLLGGTAFALIYPPLGLPIARYTDRANRRNVLAACLGFWSLMTAACGFTVGYWQLFAARFGVAAGEAGFVPPTHSLMTDYVSARRRAAGFSIIAVGAAVGTFLANGIGGAITMQYGWRMAFIALGLPGALIALLVAFTLREPPRIGASTRAADTAWPTIKRLLANRVYLLCVLASALHLMLLYGMTVWTAPYFIRTFGLSVAKAGLILGTLGALAGVLGGVTGGFVADRLAQRDKSWLAFWPALSVAVATPFCLVGFLDGYLGGPLIVAIVCLMIAVACNAMYQSATYTLVQTLVNAQERATAAALMVLIQSLIGLGLGPLLIGVLSDRLTTAHGVSGLGLALAIASLLNIVSALLFARSGLAMKRAAVVLTA